MIFFKVIEISLFVYINICKYIYCIEYLYLKIYMLKVKNFLMYDYLVFFVIMICNI